MLLEFWAQWNCRSILLGTPILGELNDSFSEHFFSYKRHNFSSTFSLFYLKISLCYSLLFTPLTCQTHLNFSPISRRILMIRDQRRRMFALQYIVVCSKKGDKEIICWASKKVVNMAFNGNTAQNTVRICCFFGRTKGQITNNVLLLLVRHKLTLNENRQWFLLSIPRLFAICTFFEFYEIISYFP